MPSLCASAVVIDSGRVLLMQRKDLGLWSLPGGHVDAEETVAQAAVREVAEETGLTAELTRLVGVYSAPQWRDGGDHTVVFAGVRTGGELRPQKSEVKEAGFTTPTLCRSLSCGGMSNESLMRWQAAAEALPGCRGSSGHLRQLGRAGTSKGSSRGPGCRRKGSTAGIGRSVVVATERSRSRKSGAGLELLQGRHVATKPLRLLTASLCA